MATTATRRVTLAVDADQRADTALLDAWLARWETRLTANSGNLGCGCCVDIYEVEAPVVALAELPDRLVADGHFRTPAPLTFWQRLTSGFR